MLFYVMDRYTMEKNVVLQKLLLDSPSFSPKEKEALNQFFIQNPDKIDAWVRILEAEQKSLELAQQSYNQNVMDVAESLITEGEQETQTNARNKMKDILEKEKEEKKEKWNQLDDILSLTQ